MLHTFSSSERWGCSYVNDKNVKCEKKLLYFVVPENGETDIVGCGNVI